MMNRSWLWYAMEAAKLAVTVAAFAALLVVLVPA